MKKIAVFAARHPMRIAMDNRVKLLAAALAGGLFAIAAGAFAQKLPPKEAAARDVCLSEGEAVGIEVLRVEKEQAQAFALLDQEFKELQRENKELKTLILVSEK